MRNAYVKSMGMLKESESSLGDNIKMKSRKIESVGMYWLMADVLMGSCEP
jgi:hypothetical protein